jgi:tetratricopeptide (TPR) repeat protein
MKPMSNNPDAHSEIRPLSIGEMAQPGWQALACGDIAKAKAIFTEIRQMKPLVLVWRIGLAQVAVREKDPQTALQLLDEVVPQPAQLPVAWIHIRGNALSMLGRMDEAEYIFRQAMQLMPDEVGVRLSYVNLLRKMRRSADALTVLDAGGDSFSDHPGVITNRLSLYFIQGRMADADRWLSEVIRNASSAAALQRIFIHLPRVYGDSDRWHQQCVALRLRLDALHAVQPCDTEGAVLSALLHFALGDIESFLNEAQILLQAGYSGPFATSLREVEKALRQPDKTVAKVIVIGLSKTGTSTMDAALRRLGLAAYHNHHPLTRQQLREEDVELFDAVSDTPIAHIFESLAERYPTARFILTRRPEDAWLKSMNSHYQRLLEIDTFEMLRDRVADPEACPGGSLWREIHESLYTRHGDLMAAFRAHDVRVREFFKDQPGRLLEFDVFSGDGWQKLCTFLDLPVPDEAFPWENAAPLHRAGK